MKNSNHKLSRTAFVISRLLDFCSEKELIAQTGHTKELWPMVILKELVDNALDASEEHGVTPIINVTVDDDGIAVADNGPGLPPETVTRVLDFSVRVSSRDAYVSPTRGAQGNALKTIVAMPFVLDGDRGRIVICAKGIRHDIDLRLDPIRQEPIIDRVPSDDQFVKTGTFVRVLWPNSARSLLTGAKLRFLQIIENYTFLNPHLTIAWAWFGEHGKLETRNPTWKKWLACNPTSPHWYRLSDFERLVSACLSDDAEKDRSRTVREVVTDFSGLKGTAKQKKVLETTGLAGKPLSTLMNGNGLDHDRTSGLLTAMKNVSGPVKPAALGIIGRRHLEACFLSMGAAMETFQYRKKADVWADLPFVLETAFAWCPSAPGRRLVTGLNWSPGIINPFRQLGPGESLESVLADAYAGEDEPVTVFVHLACPRLEFTDRGKSTVAIPYQEHDE